MATDVPGMTHLTGLNVNFLSHRMIGNTSETMMICPISIPILNDNSDVANWLPSSRISESIPAKPNPWISPKPKASHGWCFESGLKIFMSATYIILKAMADSINLPGNCTISNVARIKVIL